MRRDAIAAPVAESARITSLDLVRGVAVLGILLMNVVHFKFGRTPYLNLSAGGSESWLDWVVGIGGEILVDQKFMGIFSLLFGAGILLFIERAEARGGRPVLLNLWRNALLLGIGILHTLLWVRRRVDRLRRVGPVPHRLAEAPGSVADRGRRDASSCFPYPFSS